MKGLFQKVCKMDACKSVEQVTFTNKWFATGCYDIILLVTIPNSSYVFLIPSRERDVACKMVQPMTFTNSPKITFSILN
jgi:hypothetical protein